MSTLAQQKGVPEGTETEDWRVMSAQFAWLHWLIKRRNNGVADIDTELSEWPMISEGYRTYVRRALRALENQGIHVSRANMITDVPINSKEWNKLSRRAAWIFWLVDRRKYNAVDKAAEKREWMLVAKEETASMRKVLAASNRHKGIAIGNKKV